MEKDYIDIGTVTPGAVFSAKLAKVMLDYNKQHKPFCEPCARLEFRDKLENAEKESERRHGFVKVDEIKIDVKDFSKYADPENFEMIEDQEDVQDKVIEGSRTQVVIGHTISYRCKKRGHGLSVFIPIAEYNEMQRAKSKKGKEE